MNQKAQPMKQLLFKLTTLFIFWGTAVIAQPSFQTRIVKDSLFIPWEIIYGPDDHIWFTQKNGYICRLEPKSGRTDTVHHESETLIRGEGGMLGMALHPEFLTTPHVFVAYNYLKNGSYTEKVVRYRYNGSGLQDPTILIDDINAAFNHNGCRLLIWGDKLFITTGDAEQQSAAQQPSSVNGKILRINLDGTIPADNPISGSAVWTWGHRNAQGLVVVADKLISTEHGPSNDDELNIIVKGRNYGWPQITGFCDQPQEQQFCSDSNVVESVLAWTPTLAVSDLAYYSDRQGMFPEWQGQLLMTTLKDNKLYQIKLDGNNIPLANSAKAVDGIKFGRLRDICISPDGRVFLSTSNSVANGTRGSIDRIIELYDPTHIGTGSINADEPFFIYPNPVREDVIRIVSKNNLGTETYTIADLQGRKIQSGVLSASGLISVSDLPSGYYFLRLMEDSKNPYCKKLIKY